MEEDLKCAPRLPGCGTQHPHRALGGTRVLLAAAPTTPPCFRHWRRSSSLQRKNYFNFRDSGASVDAPLSHFHGWGRNGKRHLQRLLPAEAAALRGIPSYTTQQGRPANAGRPCCTYWKGSIGRWQLLFRQTQLFQPVPCADDLYLGHTLAGRKGALTHVGQQPGLHSPAGCLGGVGRGAFVVPSVPRFARFGRFWARIAPQMR